LKHHIPVKTDSWDVKSPGVTPHIFSPLRKQYSSG
jgi:hypothetical protein